MFTPQALHPDVREEGLLRGKALLAYGHFDPVLPGIRVPGQPEMDSLTIVLDPVGVVLLPHTLVQRHLLHRLPVAEYASPPVQVGGHVRLIIFNEQPIVQDIDRAEGIVSPEHVRIQPVSPDPDT